MRIGYARTSTSNQKYSLENQIDKLTQNGCEKIFSEEISSVSAKRPAFDSAIEFARDGDTLIVTTLTRSLSFHFPHFRGFYRKMVESIYRAFANVSERILN